MRVGISLKVSLKSPDSKKKYKLLSNCLLCGCSLIGSVYRRWWARLDYGVCTEKGQKRRRGQTQGIVLVTSMLDSWCPYRRVMEVISFHRYWSAFNAEGTTDINWIDFTLLILSQVHNTQRKTFCSGRTRPKMYFSTIMYAQGYNELAQYGARIMQIPCITSKLNSLQDRTTWTDCSRTTWYTPLA